MAKSKLVKCQNCGKEFVIEPEDLAFYERIGVPAPTFCPDCRLQRRLVFRNERTLYKRKCDLCGKEIISMYPPDAPFPVYCQECWWSDKWDPMDYGRDYDFSKPFFEQFRELYLKVPRVAIINKGSINSPYTNLSANNRNSYLLVESSNNEDCYYGYWLEGHCKDVVDSAFLTKVEIAYESLFLWDSFKLFFSNDCRNCFDGTFLSNCVNVNNSFACVNLRNKSYYIFNKPYSKEEYEKKIKSFDLGSYRNLVKLKKEFDEFALKFPKRFAYIRKSVNCSGDYIINSKDCQRSFYIEDAENVKFSTHVFDGVKDHMDVDTVGIGGELCYESINTALGAYKMRFCVRCWTGRDSLYCDNCDDIESCFGCLSLRNKKYCILNKQYSKEEYFKMVERIKKHMNEMPYISKIQNSKIKNQNDKSKLKNNKNQKEIVYKYGEFFPPELSPFAYNETIAQEYFPLSREEALEQGYRWKDPEERNYQITMKAEDIPDHIRDVRDSITEEVIECKGYKENPKEALEHGCTTAFKILPQELEFYRKMNLPLPRYCPNCRHYHRLQQRNPLKLYKRQCMCGGEESTNGVYKNTSKHNHGSKRCPNTFYTTYAPDRPEIVYCEECYKKEVE